MLSRFYRSCSALSRMNWRSQGPASSFFRAKSMMDSRYRAAASFADRIHIDQKAVLCCRILFRVHFHTVLCNGRRLFPGEEGLYKSPDIIFISSISIIADADHFYLRCRAALSGGLSHEQDVCVQNPLLRTSSARSARFRFIDFLSNHWMISIRAKTEAAPGASDACSAPTGAERRRGTVEGDLCTLLL